jgi:outer membrane lipoprotein-sorting protein
LRQAGPATIPLAQTPLRPQALPVRRLLFPSLRSAGWLAFLAFLGSPSLHANRIDELVRIHTEAIGGASRIEALKAMRATGTVSTGGSTVRFTLFAARPNRIRVESQRDGRTLVQAYDGDEPAWEFDTGSWPPRYQDMPEAAARTFVDDSEFDDPLVGGAARGYDFDRVEEVTVDGRKLLRVLVTHRLLLTFSLLVDPETYFIIGRVEQRRNPLGGKSSVITEYADFRPVEGVLLPHRIVLRIDGQVRQKTTIEAIQPNPDVTSETFSRPKAQDSAASGSPDRG